MKRWALLTVFLYALVISILATPLLYFLGSEDVGELAPAFFIFFVPALILIQGILLLVPAAVARERPVKRRTALTSAVVGALLMAVLLTSFVFFLFLILWGESSARWKISEWALVVLPAGLWVFWGVVFYRSHSPREPGLQTNTITKWLLTGSILEILIAIPSHIISRNRNECCAPGFTLLGLVTGISVAVMAFGPGLFFLFVRKVREKRKAQG